MSSKKRVLVGTPSWGTAPPECCNYRENLYAQHVKRAAIGALDYSFDCLVTTDQVVQYSREQICRQAVEEGYDYVGMIDDDMMGRRGEYDLWERLLKHDVDIVAPIMFMRQKPHLPVVYGVKGGVDPEGNFRTYGTYIIRNYPKETLFECDAIGFGAVLIKTEIIKKMRRPWFYVTNMDKLGNTGEDVYFCVQARKVGARVFVDSSTHLLHLGPRTYVGEREYEACNPELVEVREICGDWDRNKQKENLIA